MKVLVFAFVLLFAALFYSGSGLVAKSKAVALENVEYAKLADYIDCEAYSVRNYCSNCVNVEPWTVALLYCNGETRTIKLRGSLSVNVVNKLLSYYLPQE